jgi:hypothetical protein
LELFRQFGICCFSVRYWSCSASAVFVVFLLDIGAVHDSAVFVVFFVRYCSCSDSAVFVVFLLDVGAVHDSAVFVVFLFVIGAVQTVWYLLFFC